MIRKNPNVKAGDRIRLLAIGEETVKSDLFPSGKDEQMLGYVGGVYTVDFIDSLGYIHCKEMGLAIFPDEDTYEIV